MVKRQAIPYREQPCRKAKLLLKTLQRLERPQKRLLTDILRRISIPDDSPDKRKQPLTMRIDQLPARTFIPTDRTVDKAQLIALVEGQRHILGTVSRPSFPVDLCHWILRQATSPVAIIPNDDNITVMAKRQDDKPSGRASIVNRKARFNYDIIETYEAGLVLVGSEVKSLRSGSASLTEAYVRIIAGQPCLIGANIPPYAQAGRDNHVPDRRRKLLLHAREINKLTGAVAERGFTIVPLKLYFNARGYAKLQIGLAKGKTTHDKRRQIRDRDMRRDTDREMRRYRR